MTKTKSGHGEVDAMRRVEQALKPLENDACGRVLRWAFERFGLALPASSARGTASARARVGAQAVSTDDGPRDVGDFYAQFDPQTEPERALVVAYWVQEIHGETEFEAQTVNTQLKHLGHGVSNITRALDDLKGRKPQLVIQIQKSGKSRQARKRYKVTSAGKAEVQRMLAGEGRE